MAVPSDFQKGKLLVVALLTHLLASRTANLLLSFLLQLATIFSYFDGFLIKSRKIMGYLAAFF